jgi:hypothetical protein
LISHLNHLGTSKIYKGKGGKNVPKVHDGENALGENALTLNAVLCGF